MPLTRRRFIKTSALSALAAGCALGPARVFGQESTTYYQVPHEATTTNIYYFEQSTFEPYVGGYFRAYAGRTATTLKLTAVKSYAPSTSTKLTTTRTRQTESFTLTFQGGSLSTLSGGVYTLEHGALGKFELFMTSYKSDGIYYYEAVINQFS